MSLLIALYSFIFLSVFNFTSPLMGSIYIVSELGGSTDISSYAVTFFGLGNACTFPLARILADRLGHGRILFFFSLLFLITLVLSSLMPTFPLFVLVRFFNGVSCGVFFPISVSLLQQVQTPSQKKNFMPLLAFLISVTPVLGACFGGVVAYLFHWSWIFYLQLPLTIFAIFTLFWQLDSFKNSLKNTPYDIVGLISYFICIGSWVSFVGLGQQLDWLRSPFLVFLLALGSISLIFFIRWELRQSAPLLDLRLFAIPRFAFSTTAIFLLFSAYFGMVVLLSLWLHIDVNYTPLWIALLLFHMFLAALCLFFFVLKCMKKVPPFLPVVFAILAFTVSCFYSAHFNVETNFARLAIARILAGFGLAFFFFPLFTICLDCLPNHKKEEGVALFQSCRLLSGSLGVAFYHTLFIRRIVFYHDRLGSSLTPWNENVQNTFQMLSPFHLHMAQKPPLLDHALQRQATALGLADCFYAMGWLMIALCILLLLFMLKKEERRIGSPSHEE